MSKFLSQDDQEHYHGDVLILSLLCVPNDTKIFRKGHHGLEEKAVTSGSVDNATYLNRFCFDNIEYKVLIDN